jgi:hypothetical protein
MIASGPKTPFDRIDFDYPASSLGEEKRLTYILGWDNVIEEYSL